MSAKCQVGPLERMGPLSLADGLVCLALGIAAAAGLAAWAPEACAPLGGPPAAKSPLCQRPVEHQEGCGPDHMAKLACADTWGQDLTLTGADSLPRAGDRTCRPAPGAPLKIEPGGMRPAWRLMAGLGLDINRADAAALQLLPRIGPRMAERILAYRRVHGDFARPEQLRAVAGMGPQVWAGLKSQVCVGPRPED